MRHLLVLMTGCTLALSLSMASGRPASAQDVQLASRAPRFLVETARAAEPKVVDANSIPVLKRRITVDLRGATLEQALTEITRQAGLALMYSPALHPNAGPVRLQAGDITVAAALTEVLLETGADVLITAAGQAVITKRAPSAEKERPVTAGAVTGRVTDAKTGTGLVGATVILEGTKLGATTGPDGRYRIAEVPPGAYTVRVRYIGYAPRAVAVTVGDGEQAAADIALDKTAQQLDQMVVTGTVTSTAVKELPTPITVITADDIRELGIQHVGQLFRGTVPGLSAFEGSEASYFAEVNVRGKNTFGGASIKTYIDGVEVVNPAFITTIDPNSIERIEIIRGPQASTIYGSGATGGVMQIFTKKGQNGTRRPGVDGKVSAGALQGQYADHGAALRQDHALTLLGRSESFSYNVGGTYAREGAWVPRFNREDFGVSGGLRAEQGPVTIETTVRHYSRAWDAPFNPLYAQFAASAPSLGTYSYERDVVQQETLGLNLTVAASPHWQHRLALGYDRNAYRYYNTQPQRTTPADTFYYISDVATDKLSAAYNMTVDVPLAARISSTLTLGADHNTLEQSSFYTFDAVSNSGSITAQNVSPDHDKTPTTGFFAQAKLALADRLFITGGLRADHSPTLGRDYGSLAWAPRIGASYVAQLGDLSLKLRGAYGRTLILPASGYSQATVTPTYVLLPSPNLGPEEQQGWDAGVELYWGARASLSVTRYDQDAINLLDVVLIDPNPARQVYQSENVGRIKNKGWELEGAVHAGILSLTGTFTRVSSTVRALAATYTGDLQIGDEMLGVPRTVAGANLTVRLPRGSARVGVSHLGDWTQLDYLALYSSDLFFGTTPFRGSFRNYWSGYPSITKVDVMVTQELNRRLSGFVQAENLFNNYRTEYYNVQVTKGRMLLLGFRFKA